jgi:uncharacterized protein (DUF1330 family)
LEPPEWASYTPRPSRRSTSSLRSTSRTPKPTEKEFAPKAQASIKSSGGKFVVIGGEGGASAKPVTAFVGTPPKRVTIQTWDSVDAIKAWYNGNDYQAALKIGEKYATFRRYIVEGQ